MNTATLPALPRTYNTAADALALVSRLPALPLHSAAAAREVDTYAATADSNRLDARDMWRAVAELVTAAMIYADSPREQRAWAARRDRAADACVGAVDPRAAAAQRAARKEATAAEAARSAAASAPAALAAPAPRPSYDPSRAGREADIAEGRRLRGVSRVRLADYTARHAPALALALAAAELAEADAFYLYCFCTHYTGGGQPSQAEARAAWDAADLAAERARVAAYACPVAVRFIDGGDASAVRLAA